MKYNSNLNQSNIYNKVYMHALIKVFYSISQYNNIVIGIISEVFFAVASCAIYCSLVFPTEQPLSLCVTVNTRLNNVKCS